MRGNSNCMQFVCSIFFMLVPTGCLDESGLDISAGSLDKSFSSVVRFSPEGTYCTGTFVASGVLLTAAHCVTSDEGDILAPDSIVYGFGNNGLEVKVHPSYQYGSRGDDIALVKFSEKASSSTTPICSEDVSIGQTVQIAGYGERCDSLESLDNCAGTAERYSGKNKIETINGENITIYHRAHPDLAYEAFANEKSKGESLESGNNKAKGSLSESEKNKIAFGGPGDSGGPLLVEQEGKWCVAGTVVGETYNSEDRAQADYVNLSAHKKWLSETIASLAEAKSEASNLKNSSNNSKSNASNLKKSANNSN